jgi:tetratricopeptide (TPR) repeat protein
MRTVPADDPDPLTAGFWANSRAGELIERAEDRQLAGDNRGALTLLEQAIPMGGPDAAYALAARVESLFELGRSSDAVAGLEALRKHRPFSAVAFHRAAEALEMNGDHRLALRWFDMALSRCTDQLNDGSSSEVDLGASVPLLLAGRRRVRTTLGFAADELDKAAAPGGQPPDVAFQGHLPLGHAAPGAVVRVLFWPRDQVQDAHRHWPALVQTPEVESSIRQRELENRQLVAGDGVHIVMVPVTVQQLLDYAARTNGDPLDARTRSQLLHERYDQGGGLPWPPQRNQRCWCGSDRKYKKCCGAVA